MQLTNIARDVGEDARAGRLYLPLDWLEEAGIDPEAFLARPVPIPGLARMVARLLAEAERLLFPGRGRRRRAADRRPAGIYAARLIYAGIGREVRVAGSTASRAAR